MSVTISKLTSRRQQREQTRDVILRAAIETFAQAGFEAASLAEIAKQAGVKKALVQYHFATKEELWQQSASQLWQQRNDYMAQFIRGSDAAAGDIAQKMGQGFTALIKFTRENPQWLWFMFHEAAVDGDRLQWLVENCLENDYLLGESFVKEFQQQGLIRKGSPQHLLHLISGALTYNLLVAPSTLRATGLDLASEDSIARQVKLLQDLLRPD